MFIFVPMKNTTELFELITSKPKWYIGLPSKNGYHNAQSANRLKNRFKNNSISEKSLINLFSYYGYFKTETKWEKI